MRNWREQRPRRRRPPRRIRKKLRLHDFTQYGVSIRFDCGDLAIDSPELDAALDAFLSECDEIGIAVGGGMGKMLDGTTASEFFGTAVEPHPRNARRKRHAQLHPAQAEALRIWLEQQPWCRNVVVRRQDANYEPFDA